MATSRFLLSVLVWGSLGPSGPVGPAAPEEQIGAPRPAPPPPQIPRARRMEPGAGAGEETVDPAQLGLRRRDDGGYEYLDPHARFSAVVERDGRVKFADRYRRPTARSRQRGACCGLPPEGLAGLNPFRGVPTPGLVEWIYAMYRVDPNRSAKDAFLERTRAFRTKLAVEWALANIRRRLSELDRELVDLWRDASLSVERRKQVLFERWDECEERFSISRAGLTKEAISAIDEARAEAGATARGKIERFIRKALPPGSRFAYTPKELEELNARRRSRRPFAPYGAR